MSLAPPPFGGPGGEEELTAEIGIPNGLEEGGDKVGQREIRLGLGTARQGYGGIPNGSPSGGGDGEAGGGGASAAPIVAILAQGC